MAERSDEVVAGGGGPVDPPVAGLADEGFLLASAALRLTVKNIIVIAVLREHAPWNEEALLDEMRRNIRSMVVERRAAAVRVVGLIERASGLSGRAGFADDFRQGDVPKLKRRLRVEHTLVERLEELLTDDGALVTTLYAARDAAMEEIQSHHFTTHAHRENAAPTHHDRERQMAALRWQLLSMTRSAGS